MRRMHVLFLCAAPCGIALMPHEVSAKSLKVVEERLIGSCIRKAALGQPWLEKTLWGLRDQKRAGWERKFVTATDRTIWAPCKSTVGGFRASPLGSIDRKRRYATGCVSTPVSMQRLLAGCFCPASGRQETIGLPLAYIIVPTQWRQRRYRNAVAQHLRGRFGANVFQ